MGAKQSKPHASYSQRLKVKSLWALRNSRVHSKLSSNICREICAYISDVSPRLLASIRRSLVSLYDFDLHRVTSSTLCDDFPTGGVSCMLDSTRLLYVGGSSPSRCTLLLDTSTWTVCQSRLTIRPREVPGVIRAEDCVYLFGADDRDQTSSERLVLGQWTSLPKMAHPRSHFTPCVYKDRIFLTDVRVPIEAFDIRAERYRRVKFDYQFDPSYSVSWVKDEKLILLTQDEVVELTLEPQGHPQSLFVISPPDEVCSSSCPVQIGPRLYWISLSTGILMSFDQPIRTISRVADTNIAVAGI